MMTRRDYVRAAQIFHKHYETHDEWSKGELDMFWLLVGDFSVWFAHDNKNFDNKRFTKAVRDGA